jgi:cbb3-type cytochrome oxidase subunit 3
VIVNVIRIAVTVALFVLFVALGVYTWSRARREEFAAAAKLPFADNQENT